MYKLLLTSVAIMAAVAFAIVSFAQGTSSSGTRIHPDERASVPATFDPAQYGLPDTIGGYKVLAVLTSDNTACMMPGERRLILQATQPTVQDYLKDTHYDAIKKDLQERGLAEMAKWGEEIVGPGVNLKQVMSEQQRWNEHVQEYGCMRTQPILIATPAK
jgi:hypothetical protein